MGKNKKKTAALSLNYIPSTRKPRSIPILGAVKDRLVQSSFAIKKVIKQKLHLSPSDDVPGEFAGDSIETGIYDSHLEDESQHPAWSHTMEPANIQLKPSKKDNARAVRAILTSSIS
jgi:hypothetical protein